MARWKARLLRGGLYALLFVAATAAFLWIAFPWDRAVPYVEAAIAKRLDMDVRIESISPSLPVGVEIEGITLRARKPDRLGRYRAFHAERVTIRAALSTLLGGDVDVDYAVEAVGGTIEGQVYRAAADTRILARVSGISPGEISTLRDLVGLPIEGRIHGAVDLTLRDHKFSRASGTIDLVARNVIAGDGKAKLRLRVTPEFSELQEFLDRVDQGVALPPMNVGTFTAKVRVSRGAARVIEMGSSSEHFEMKGEGTIDLKDPVSTSEVALYVSYRFTDAYTSLDTETQSMIASMSESPRYRRALRADGSYGFRLQGILRDRIRPFPARENVPGDGRPPADTPFEPFIPIPPAALPPPPAVAPPPPAVLREGPE